MSVDVIVLGAGVAGLSAATALAESDVRVLVFEARPGMGGRASAFTDPETGDRVDNGQHVLFGCYHETFRFLRRIGAEASVTVPATLSIDVIDRAGRRSRLECPPLPPPLHLVAGVLEWEALAWRDRLSILRLRNPMLAAREAQRFPPHPLAARDPRPIRAAASPGETVQQWLIRNGQAPRLIELLWEPLARAALNQSIDRAAALPFTRVLADLFGRGAHDAAVVLPRVPLDELYAVPAKAFIEARGGAVRLNAPGRVTLARGGSVQVRVQNEVFEAPTVICAVPWHELPDVLAEVPLMAATLEHAAQTAASSIVTVNLWFDRPVFDRPFVGLPGRTMQWAFAKGTRLSLVSSGADALVAKSNDDLARLALKDVVDAFPAAASAPLQRAMVVREKRASFSVAPGQPPRPPTETGVPGLLLAGDWVDTGLPATIESAAMSGHWAAAVTEHRMSRTT
jgi:zeta-carotene desaturase